MNKLEEKSKNVENAVYLHVFYFYIFYYRYGKNIND